MGIVVGQLFILIFGCISIILSIIFWRKEEKVSLVIAAILYGIILLYTIAYWQFEWIIIKAFSILSIVHLCIYILPPLFVIMGFNQHKNTEDNDRLLDDLLEGKSGKTYDLENEKPETRWEDDYEKEIDQL